jgi:hypothetical protein
MVDDTKFRQVMGQMLSDLGAAASVALVRIGDAWTGPCMSAADNGNRARRRGRGQPLPTCANGFRSVRRATEPPFNKILEARP